MEAVLERLDGIVRVQIGRQANVENVHLLGGEHGAKVIVRPCAQLLGRLIGVFMADVAHGDDLGLADLGPSAAMRAADAAHSDHSNFQHIPALLTAPRSAR